jgi:hypothetical protein
MQDNKTNSSPLISIIIPCYNDAQYIEQAINSALNQSYSNKEIIVIDDGSNAETKIVLKKLESKITKLISQKNQGQSTARNIGILESRGEYILTLDSDDYFEPTFCDKAIAILEGNSSIKIITCYTNRIFETKNTDVFKPDGGKLEGFLLYNCAMGSAMFKKIDWQETKGYDENMRKGFEDWEFYIRLLKEGGSAYVIPEILFNYRSKENSTTTRANKIKYELSYYIYSKHKDLYVVNFDLFISYLLSKTRREEQEKIKNTKRIDFKIGKTILKPLRWFKSILR